MSHNSVNHSFLTIINESVINQCKEKMA